jgi:serine O-acetyltransferase
MIIIDDFKAKAQWLYGTQKTAHVFRALLSDASLSMMLYRSMTFFGSHTMTKPIAAVLQKVNAIICGAVIGRGAKFGRGFVILHSVGIVINGKVKGGDDIVLESGVVIGEEKRGCPVLGCKIFIGSGAKVFGNITIGSNVTIGANAVVNKSLPDNTVAVGIPAKVIRYKASSE